MTERYETPGARSVSEKSSEHKLAVAVVARAVQDVQTLALVSPASLTSSDIKSPYGNRSAALYAADVHSLHRYFRGGRDAGYGSLEYMLDVIGDGAYSEGRHESIRAAMRPMFRYIADTHKGLFPASWDEYPYPTEKQLASSGIFRRKRTRNNRAGTGKVEV